MKSSLGLNGNITAGGGGGGRGGDGGCGASPKKMASKMEQDYTNEAELELGLGLSLTSGRRGGRGYGKIMTTKDYSSAAVTVSNVSGTKRAAEFVGPSEVGYSASNSVASQVVVGWPPIRTYRMNNLVNMTKIPKNEEADKGVGGNDESRNTLKKKKNISNENDTVMKETGHSGFVKVNMDGLPIGRKVDLYAHSCYETFAQTLEEMFLKPSTCITTSICGEKQHAAPPSKLLGESSEYALTYEDEDGDWMLVGDVPWSMFLSTVKRLRITKTSDANGLAPRFQEMDERQKRKPI